MWQNDKNKSEWLPVEKREWGYEQRSSFNHPDLWHESVIDVESPVLESSSVTGGDTQLLSILVVGDQNAGKSTLLHSFSFHADPRFLHLSSELSILSSNFVNSRILLDDEAADSPMDEIPFIDTDIARATVVMNTEEFCFFLDQPTLPGAPCYTCLEFVEFGGDHLDRLAARKRPENASLCAILERSLKIIKGAAKIVYFINGSSGGDDALMLRRLRFLDSCFSRDLLVFLSRGASAQLCSHYDQLLASLEWNFRAAPCVPLQVLNEDASLNDSAIVDFVRQLFASGAASSTPLWPLLVATVLDCWKEALAADLQHLQLYISAHSLLEHVRHSQSSLPESSVMQLFPRCAQDLVRQGIALRRGSSVCLRFQEAGCWTREAVECPLAIRFPVYSALVKCLAEPFVYWGCAASVPASVVSDLQHEICQAWSNHNMELFVLLLEDWSLCDQGSQFPVPLERANAPTLLPEPQDTKFDLTVSFVYV